MADRAFALAQITQAAVDIEAVVRFYNAVFDAELVPVPLQDTTVYRGTLLGTTFVVCPEELAGVQADRSRHQLSFTVPDLADTVERALAAGGTLFDEAQAGDAAVVTVLDPDSNSIVFVEALA